MPILLSVKPLTRFIWLVCSFCVSSKGMSVYLCSEAHGEFKGSPYIQQAFPQAWFPLGGAEKSLEALSRTEGRAGEGGLVLGPQLGFVPSEPDSASRDRRQ